MVAGSWTWLEWMSSTDNLPSSGPFQLQRSHRLINRRHSLSKIECVFSRVPLTSAESRSRQLTQGLDICDSATQSLCLLLPARHKQGCACQPAFFRDERRGRSGGLNECFSGMLPGTFSSGKEKVKRLVSRDPGMAGCPRSICAVSRLILKHSDRCPEYVCYRLLK